MDKQEWMREFGYNLKLLLNEEGITQKQLAEESGITQTNISQYMNGTRMPSVRAIVNIAQALNRETDELINFDEMIE